LSKGAANYPHPMISHLKDFIVGDAVARGNLRFLLVKRHADSIYFKQPESRNRLPTQTGGAVRSRVYASAPTGNKSSAADRCIARTIRSKTAIFTKRNCD